MPRSNSTIILCLLSIVILFNSCSLGVKKFTKDQLKWFQPYTKTDSIVFISEKNEIDTIVFFKTALTRDTVRNFIELGYYSTIYLSVPYLFTPGSYHQSALMGDGKKRYDQNLFNLSQNSKNYIQFEITFIGTIFNGKELNNVDKIAENLYYFDSKKATYSGMNVEKGINDFTFDTRIGILKYTDKRNVQWRRAKK
ncbi:hypothetical protein [Mucilaginibacter sp. SG564]|uniref:hypothetical protein n=1 Tax=Mucilaginibacter sp. SG564 TaxID=2587022 RepID=UPI0015566734|nr:hypothetical protein [Mucilaginibacter sp. SG564]NOW96443.1 hypothetical protein [Mucilaginibacter sp. SG564]